MGCRWSQVRILSPRLSNRRGATFSHENGWNVAPLRMRRLSATRVGEFHETPRAPSHPQDRAPVSPAATRRKRNPSIPTCLKTWLSNPYLGIRCAVHLLVSRYSRNRPLGEDWPDPYPHPVIPLRLLGYVKCEGSGAFTWAAAESEAHRSVQCQVRDGRLRPLTDYWRLFRRLTWRPTCTGPRGVAPWKKAGPVALSGAPSRTANPLPDWTVVALCFSHQITWNRVTIPDFPRSRTAPRALHRVRTILFAAPRRTPGEGGRGRTKTGRIPSCSALTCRVAGLTIYAACLIGSLSPP